MFCNLSNEVRYFNVLQFDYFIIYNSEPRFLLLLFLLLICSCWRGVWVCFFFFVCFCFFFLFSDALFWLYKHDLFVGNRSHFKCLILLCATLNSWHQLPFFTPNFIVSLINQPSLCCLPTIYSSKDRYWLHFFDKRDRLYQDNCLTKLMNTNGDPYHTERKLKLDCLPFMRLYFFHLLFNIRYVLGDLLLITFW